MLYLLVRDVFIVLYEHCSGVLNFGVTSHLLVSVH